MALETGAMPLFGGRSQALNGAASLQLETARLSAFASIVSTADIPIRPLLSGTPEERQARPELRPGDCSGCSSYLDRVYLGYLNAAREFAGSLPRTGLHSRLVPVFLPAGITAKYFWEELEGGDYEAQSLNLDAGLSLRLLWDYDPARKIAHQVFKLNASAFELLPTRQRSDIGGYSVFEEVNRRWHVSGSFEQGIPRWRSTLVLGLEHRSEGEWPALGGEWVFADALGLRGGWDGNFWAGGFSLRYRWLGLHYALRHHDLGTSFYQVSLQLQRARL
jgi:hypothetical protein